MDSYAHYNHNAFRQRSQSYEAGAEQASQLANSAGTNPSASSYSPCHENYNPVLGPSPTHHPMHAPATPRDTHHRHRASYSPAENAGNTNHSQHNPLRYMANYEASHHHQQQQQAAANQAMVHLFAAATPHNTYGVPVPGLHHTQQHFQNQQNLATVAATAALNANGNNSNPSSYETLAQTAPAPLHQRHSSLDELLLLSPSLLADVGLEPLPAAVSHTNSISSGSNGSGNSLASVAFNPRRNPGTHSQSHARSEPLDLYRDNFALPPPSQTVSSHQSSPSTRHLFQPPVAAVSETYSNPQESFLDELTLQVPGLSLEPIPGRDVLERLRTNMNDVLTRYIPCVDFLVQCQQDLRKGLAAATSKVRKGSRHVDRMTARQFYGTFVESLPGKFYLKNQYIMENAALQTATQGLQKLKSDAKASERQGCEAIKNCFLGGMKEGESWGLRKWLSQNGNALRICTDLECILKAMQNLDKTASITIQLAELLRPIAQRALDRLKADVPASYQERSAAHPYLPFFHRLEAALRGVATFDPTEDDVICVDDSDDENDADEVLDVTIQPLAPPRSRSKVPAVEVTTQHWLTGFESKKRKADSSEDETESQIPAKRFTRVLKISDRSEESASVGEGQLSFKDDGDNFSSSGESDNESVVEVVGVQPAQSEVNNRNRTLSRTDDWVCSSCSILNAPSDSNCLACGDENYMKDLVFFKTLGEPINVKTGLPASKVAQQRKELIHDMAISREVWPAMTEDQMQEAASLAYTMADSLDQLAVVFEEGQMLSVRPPNITVVGFWDGDRYGSALRLLGEILRKSEAIFFLDRVDEDYLISRGLRPYSHVIKHPLSFRDIVGALVEFPEEMNTNPSYSDGHLPVRGLASWNMWKGADLLQAIDLVFLNCLAYGKAVVEGKSPQRSDTNILRKKLWNGISAIVRQHVGTESGRRKLYTPTRRSETSGFVVYKIKER